MDINEFKQKNPKYAGISDETLITEVNKRMPGTITPRPGVAGIAGDTTISVHKPTYTEVTKFDPRRVLPSYAYRAPMTPSDIGKAGAEYFFKTQLPESEARAKVSLAIRTPSIIKTIRMDKPGLDSVDDFTLIEEVVKHKPEYLSVLEDMRKQRNVLYKKIDKIEFKNSIGAGLDKDEAYINAMILPEDKSKVAYHTIKSFINSASFGTSEFILNNLGFRSTASETGMEAVGAGIGSFAGFIAGPLTMASNAVKYIPGVASAFTPIKAGSKVQMLLKPLLRGSITMGVASASVIPGGKPGMEGFIGDRVKQFGSGFIMGAEMAPLNYIPNRAVRMATASLALGGLSRLREESLEEQIFNLGIGAYAGFHGYKDTLKAEAELARLAEYGVTSRTAKEQLLANNEMLLQKLKVLIDAEGQPYTSVIDTGRNFYTPVTETIKTKTKYVDPKTKKTKVVETITKGWRDLTLDAVKGRLRELRAEKGFQLRNDKVSNLFEELKTVNLNNITNAQLFNLNFHVKPENTPPVRLDMFKDRPPSKSGIKGKHLTPFHWIARRGLKQMEDLGFGGKFKDAGYGEGLTGTIVAGDNKHDTVMMLHTEMSNNWKRLVGLNKETSRRIALHRDGALDLDTMAKNHLQYRKELDVSNQIGRYTNMMLEYQNRHRAKYGKEPIKPVEGSYFPHLFDAIIKEAITSKYPYPEYIEGLKEFMTPTEAQNPHLKSRRGIKGYKEDIWHAIDAYSYWASNYVSDDGLRQAAQYRKFIKREQEINNVTGKQSPIDWNGMDRSLKNWIDVYAGKPGKVDHMVKDVVKNLPPHIRRVLPDAERFFGTWRSLIYTGALGYRPKLALRNLGQHFLILGMENPRHLWQAIRGRGTAEWKALQEYNIVLKGRERGFAPEIPHDTAARAVENVRRSGMYLFAGADRLNVENAFMAGYYGEYARGLKLSPTIRRNKAIQRGNEVAATAEFMYTKGNRGPISNLWGLSHTAGKFASMFTTWPIDKIEYSLMLSKPENRAGLIRYLGLVGLAALSSKAMHSKVSMSSYLGWGAETGLIKKLTGGMVDVSFILNPKLLIAEDIKKAINDDALWKLFLYDLKENTAFWEKF